MRVFEQFMENAYYEKTVHGFNHFSSKYALSTFCSELLEISSPFAVVTVVLQNCK